MSELGVLRQNIDAALGEGNGIIAYVLAKRLWQLDPTSGTASYLSARVRAIRDAGAALTPHRLSIVRSYTVEPLVPFLKAGALACGIELDVTVHGFNTYAQDILNSQSDLYASSPDSIFLCIDERDATRVTDEDLAALLQAIRRQSSANIVVQGFEHLIPGLSAAQKGVYGLRYRDLVERATAAAWYDERKWQAMRLPLSAVAVGQLAAEFVKYLAAFSGRSAKCIAVDLDNTLWKGVLGEDGPAGVEPVTELQAVLQTLRGQGVLLVMCTKNNERDVRELFEQRDDMPLRWNDFAAHYVNWNDKSENLRAIARDLNIGIDSVAFIDDNPVERARVAQAVPYAYVLELPADSNQFAAVTSACPLFARFALSEEDKQRSTLYEAEFARKALAARIPTREEFLRSLEQEIEVAHATPQTLPRLAQLTQKTNQFNVTTRRYTEAAFERMLSAGGWYLYSVRVRDKFGDNGIVGAALVEDRANEARIDAFLLSCRVIGRDVELAFLEHIATEARQRGVRRLIGEFIPTPKNAPAANFYEQAGFEPAGEGKFVFDLQRQEAAV